MLKFKLYTNRALKMLIKQVPPSPLRAIIDREQKVNYRVSKINLICMNDVI